MKATIKTKTSTPADADVRTDLSEEALKRAFGDNLFYVYAKFTALATKQDDYLALAYTVRNHLLHRWLSTAEAYIRQKARTVTYFSAEFLLEPHLGDNFLNLRITDLIRKAVSDLGLIYEALPGQDEVLTHPRKTL